MNVQDSDPLLNLNQIEKVSNRLIRSIWNPGKRCDLSWISSRKSFAQRKVRVMTAQRMPDGIVKSRAHVYLILLDRALDNYRLGTDGIAISSFSHFSPF